MNEHRAKLGVPRGVWALGFVSLLMDASSELIHALLPIYLVAVLGASMATVGLIEGIAEGTAAVTKLFSGVLSDWLKKRKILVVAGYGLAALTKPVFALATSVAWVFAARFVDRIAKGIRGAPRDALIADLTAPEQRGAAYGLRQSLDTVGAFLGPLLAIAIMWLMAGNIRGVFAFAIVPAALSVLVLAVFVKEPAERGPTAAHAPQLRASEMRLLGGPYWRVIAVAAALSLARFSDAFLILKAQESGLALALVPLVLVLMNAAYSLAAFPAGVFSDRYGRNGILTLGLGVLVAGNLTLAGSSSVLGVAVGIALWGIHMGLTQGVVASLVADTAPAPLRGTAFGILNVVSGVALLVASVLAGVLWDVIGPEGMFLASAAFALLASAAVGASASSPRRRLR
jgi:MFS family permease